MKTFQKVSGDIFEVLFEAVSEGVIVVNKKKLIVACNHATNEMFGYEIG